MKKPFPPRSTRSGSEGLRIAQEIAAIQAALNKHGYRTRKQPKQAAWKVFTPHPKSPNSPPLARGTGRVKNTPPLARGARGVPTCRFKTANHYDHTILPPPTSQEIPHYNRCVKRSYPEGNRTLAQNPQIPDCARRILGICHSILDFGFWILD
jgi:hypothetical protein